jgi:hypothetical protein
MLKKLPMASALFCLTLCSAASLSAMKSQAALNTVANAKTLVAKESKATPVISSVDDQTISISNYFPETKLLAQSGQSVLTGAWISFHTNNEDKDSDSHVTVQVFKNDGDLAAQTDNDFGHFDDHSNNGPYNLEVLNNAPIKSALAGGKVLIRIDPNGHDTWRFNFTLRLRGTAGIRIPAVPHYDSLTDHPGMLQPTTLN